MTFADAMIRFAEDRLLTGDELKTLFRGIGIDSTEHPEPEQIIEAMDISCIPLAAARLAAKADGTRTETDYVCDALQLMEVVKDHHLLPHSQNLPLPIEIRKAAVGLGIVADAAAALIRNRMMEPLTPIVNTPEEIAEFEQFVKRMIDDAAANRPDAGGDSGSLPTDPSGLE